MAQHRICRSCGEFTGADGACAECSASPRRNRPGAGRSIWNTRRWRALSARIIKRDRECQVCGQGPGDAANPLTADHKTPIDRGGEPWDEANLWALCNRCNGRKRNHTVEEMGWASKISERAGTETAVSAPRCAYGSGNHVYGLGRARTGLLGAC